MTRPRRVPTDGEPGQRGKPPARVERVGEGNLPFKAVSGFPGALRQHLHQANAYYQGFGEAPLPACDLPLEAEPSSAPKNR